MGGLHFPTEEMEVLEGGSESSGSSRREARKPLFISLMDTNSTNGCLSQPMIVFPISSTFEPFNVVTLLLIYSKYATEIPC